MGVADDILNGTYGKKKKQSIAEQILNGTYEPSKEKIDFKNTSFIDTSSLKDKKDSTDEWHESTEEKLKDDGEEKWYHKILKGSEAFKDNLRRFDDGYDFGDVTKTALETVYDVGVTGVSTAADVGLNAAKGVGNLGEGIVDLGTYGVAGVGSLLGADTSGIKKFAQKELVNEGLAPAIDFVDRNSILGDTADSVSQGLGYIGGTLLTGGLGKAAGLGVKGVTALTSLTTGTSAMGSGMSEAYEGGASDGEAVTYGIISGIAAAGTELIFGGLGKTLNATGLSHGLSSADDMLAQKLTSKISNVVAKNWVELGVKAGAEGSEEVIEGVINAFGKKLTYMEEEEILQLLEDESLLEQFVVGAVTSGIAQSGYVPGMTQGSLKEANETGRDFITGFTQNEQAVVDKVAEKQIAEAEKDGKKLTNKEKNKIKEEVQEDLEKGLIDTADIESVLGGEAYTKLQDTNSRVENLKKEIAEIENKPNTEATVKDIRRLNSLEQRLKEIDTTELQNNLQTEMFNKIGKDNYLQRSYYEKAQRGVRFTQEIKEDASDIRKAAYTTASEVMHNTTRAHEFVETVVKIGEDTGTKFIFVNNEKLKRHYKNLKVDKGINGLVNSKGEVLINVQGNNIFEKIVGHETTHLLEGTKEYDLLEKAIKEYATMKGEYDTKVQSLTKIYEGTDANIKKETTADLVGEYIFTDEEFVNHLSTKQPNVFKKVYDYIKHLVKQVTAGSKEARQLEKVRYRFEQAYRNVQKNGQKADTKYSLTDNKGRELSKEQQERFKDVSPKLKDENGNLKVMYHGTPNGDFTIFKDGTYFTDNKEYADIYQNPGASSISTGKVATNPKTFEVYLDIKKPFDINDAEARNIYINEYIKGGNAMGINPYLSDAEYDKIKTIDWTEGEDLRDFLIENGYDYDGLILDEGGTGGYGEEVKSRGLSYVVFNANQIKNVDNTNPTENPDIRYSLSEDGKLVDDKGNDVKLEASDVGNHNSLMVIHNLTAEKMKGILELGGFPVPSIAIVDTDKFAFTDFGGISVLFNKDTIDPSDSRNEVYDRDVWSPTFPTVEYDINNEALRKMASTNNIYRDYKDSIANDVVMGYLYAENLGQKVNSYGKEEIIRNLKEDNKLKYVYLKTIGEFEPVKKPVKYDGEISNETLQKFLDSYKGEKPLNELSYDETKALEEQVIQIITPDLTEKFKNLDAEYRDKFTKAVIDNYREYRMLDSFMRSAYQLQKNGADAQEIDTKATLEKANEVVNQEEFEKWVDNTWGKVINESTKGLRNNKDVFTPSGNRRSFKQLHDEYNLQNVVRLMTKGATTGGEGGIFTGGFGSTAAKMAHRFDTISEIKSAKDKLTTNTEAHEILEPIKEKLGADLQELATYHKEPTSFNAYDNSAEAVFELAGKKTININSFKKVLDSWYSFNTSNIPDSVLKNIIDDLNSLKNIPTDYFEAKPQRAVGLDEVQAIVIPNDTDVELKKQLTDAGLYVVEYDPNIEGDRQTKITQFDDLKFSLSNKDDIAPRQRGLTYSEDVMFNEEAIAPLQQEINNLSNKITEIMDKITVNEDDYAPIGENELSQLEEQNRQNFKTLEDDIAPVEVEEDFVDEKTPTASKSLFDTRDYAEVGNRKVKAYQYEHPEVRPYFQKAAQEMLIDLNDTIKGERSFNSQLYYDSNGEDGFYGTTRHTAKDIAELLDGIDGKYKLSYAEIRKGLEAIIEDHGAENNAASKRIEFYLDQRLRNGYVDTMGYDIPADKEYLDLMESKEYHSYFDSIPIDESLIPEVESTTPTENTTEVTNNNIVEPFEGVATQRELDLESGDITDETVSELEKKKARERKKLGDKENYIKNKVTELYDEAKALRKGVRASYDLSRLLDFAFQDIDTITKDMTPEDAKTERDRIWRDITNSFMNIKVKPFETVNPNSKIEARIRQYVGRQYDAKLDEINNLKDEDLKKITRADIKRGYINRVIEKFKEQGYDFDKILDNAKNKSTLSSVDNTPQRFVEKSLGYKEGQILNDLTSNQTALNESEAIKWLNSFTNRKDGELAKISKEYNIKPFSKEDKAAQMYGEGFFVDDNNQIIKYGDGELTQDFPDAKVRENIKKLAKDPRIRQIYDDTLNRINESRKRNGYPEIPRRNDYFLHFRAMEDTFSRMGLPFNPNDIRAKDLPTDLNGVTADLKPGQPYFASARQRKGLKTSYSLLGGMEKYLSSAKNQIFHIDDIQMLRSLRDYVADRFGQAKGLENLDELTEEEIEQRIKEVFDAHLSNFAKFLNEQANVLAGKTTLIDRGLEGIIGRRGLTTLDTINSQVGKNLIGYSIGSPFTNLIAGVQAFAKGNKFDSLKAFTQVASNKIKSIFGKSDGFMENDPLAARRQGADNFYRTPYQKISDYGYVLMGAIDNVTTEFTVRTKYNELTRKGMSHEKAIIEADKWAARILGDRSLGQQPQLYNSKLLGLITKFQLEVRNQLDSMIYDTIKEAEVNTEEIQNKLKRNRKKAAIITSTMVQLAVLQHLFGKAFEDVIGYNPAFDIISVLMTAFGFDDEEESEDTVLDNLDQAFQELLGDLPYTSTLTGGRIPIEAALPIEELIKGEDAYGNEKSRWKTIGEALPYYVLPGGYNQIKKTTQGLGMFDDDLPVSGSYTASGNLRYPVEDTIQNRIQAGIFGQYANENARDYFDNERLPLKEKQIQEYKDLDMPIKDYWKYRDGLKDLDKLEDKFDYVNKQNVTTEQKNIMINNIVDRKEKVDMSNYDDFGSLEEFDFANGKETKEKYEFLQANNISYKEYTASEESRKAYNWAYDNPENYIVSKAVTDDLVTYRKYKQDLAKFKDIKDENGKVLVKAQTQKEDYINNLDINYESKIILYKSEYSSANEYNNDIINYLNSRNDLSYEEKITIINKLKMKIDANGNVSW